MFLLRPSEGSSKVEPACSDGETTALLVGWATAAGAFSAEERAILNLVEDHSGYFDEDVFHLRVCLEESTRTSWAFFKRNMPEKQRDLVFVCDFAIFCRNSLSPYSISVHLPHGAKLQGFRFGAPHPFTSQCTGLEEEDVSAFSKKSR